MTGFHYREPFFPPLTALPPRWKWKIVIAFLRRVNKATTKSKLKLKGEFFSGWQLIIIRMTISLSLFLFLAISDYQHNKFDSTAA
jgi:hypothetical protein